MELDDILADTAGGEDEKKKKKKKKKHKVGCFHGHRRTKYFLLGLTFHFSTNMQKHKKEKKEKGEGDGSYHGQITEVG